MNIVITGASGFIGKHLLQDLEGKGYNLKIITRNPQKKFDNIPEKSEVIIADLTNYQSLENAFKNVDVIINVAAEVKDEAKLEETNIKGSENLVKAAIVNGVKKIIHLSSVGVVGMQYSNKSEKVVESAACFPKNEYERTKLASEKIIIEGCKKNNIKLNVLRPTNVFGEDHSFDALLNFMQYVSSGKPMLFTKNAMVNYVYVKDLTNTIVQLVEKDAPLILNVGEAIKLKSFISLLNKYLEKNSLKIRIPQMIINLLNLIGVYKLNTVSNQVAYIDSELTSFSPYIYGVEKGVLRTILNYKKEGKLK